MELQIQHHVQTNGYSSEYSPHIPHPISVTRGSVLNVVSLRHWTDEMLLVQFFSFEMRVECFGSSWPSINAPYGNGKPNKGIVPLSFNLHRNTNQEEFKMIKEILVTFPEDTSCKIISWKLKFGDEAGIPTNPQQYLSSIYDRFFGFKS